MGLRGRLLLLVLVPTIPALVLAVFTSLEQRHFGRAKAEKDAIRVAQLAAVQQQGLIDSARQHLMALAGLREARGNNVQAFESFFAGMRKVYGNYSDFGLIETNGSLVACSYTDRKPTNLSDRAYFQRVLRTREFGTGMYESEPSGDKPSLVFGYPVVDEQGRLIRVLYAALDLAVLSRTISKTHIPNGWMITVLDEQGRVLGRNPEPEKWVGKSFAGPGLLASIISQKEGTAEMREPGDEVRLCAFTPVGAGPPPKLFVAAGIPLSMAYAETRRILARNLIVLGLVAAAALVAAKLYADRCILRPLQALAKTTQQVTAGDLSARTGIGDASGEINQLAQAFDRMAESIQVQRLQNERFQAELEERVKERTAQLEQSNQELESFSYSVSHDLRAPLRHVQGYIEILKRTAEGQLSDKALRCLNTITAASKEMGQLIDDLLAFSRLARTEMSESPVALDALVKETIRGLEMSTQGRNIVWNVAPLPVVMGDYAMLKHVLANLLDNAIKYTRARDRAEIAIGETGAEAGRIILFVRDNGAGFDMRYVHKLFGVFQRLHRADEFEGTGIGLAIVRRVIARHGGRAWAEGSVGQGATFYFTLKPAPPAIA